MGTDIDMYVEKRIGKGNWVQVYPQVTCSLCVEGPNPSCYWCDGTKIEKGYYERNYDLFSILANVRNGTWGEDLVYISEPRGLPVDVNPEVLAKLEGRDSLSWLGLREILDFDWQKTNRKRCPVDIRSYKEIKQGLAKAPSSYCRSTSGKVVSEKRADDIIKSEVELPYIHVDYTWEEPYEDLCKHFLSRYVPAVELLGIPTDLRLVFGFC